MSAVQHSTYSRSQSHSTQNSLPPFPWEKTDLENYCHGINTQQAGRRGYDYQKLLTLLKKAVLYNLNTKTWSTLRQNLSSIQHCIPDEIKKRAEISKVLKYVEKQIPAYFCSVVSKYPLEGQSAIYCSYIRKIKRAIVQNDTRSELYPLSTELSVIQTHLPSNLLPEVQTTLTKCKNFCYDKILIRSFADNHSAQETEMDDTSRIQKRVMRPILALDGGGIRAITFLHTLKEIEKITKESIAKLFKLVGGTSTGGIVALGLTKPKAVGSTDPENNVQDLLDLYTDPQQNGQIFKQNPLHKMKNSGDWLDNLLYYHKYRSPAALFEEKFGNMPLSSALTDVLIPINEADAVVTKAGSVGLEALSGAFTFLAGLFGSSTHYSISHDSLPKTVHYFSKKGIQSVRYSLSQLEQNYSYQSHFFSEDRSNAYSIYQEDKRNFHMSYAAQVTSAAPGFFPLVKLNNTLYADGGILQNNPTIPCVLDSLEQGYRREDLFLVSLGTGVEKNPSFKPRKKTDPSSKELDLSFLVPLWFHTTQPDRKTDDVLYRILSKGAYHRFQYYFDGEAPILDDNSPETIERLTAAGQELAEENTDLLREVCKVLKPDSV